LANHTDPNLKNPWGVAFSTSSPFWVSDNATGKATLYDGTGVPNALVVTIPKFGGGTGVPTGVVSNETASFNGDRFIFATEDGTIAGWRGALGTTTEALSLPSNNNVYKGLASGAVGGHTYLYAADFRNGVIGVFKDAGAPNLTGNFTDPNLPAGFAPFNIQNLGGQMYVAYAKQATPGGADEDPGPGRGFVSVFDLNGNLIKRLVTQGALNAPWGMALTPPGFGLPVGDLLVGNFGDGLINAYDPSGTLVGTIADTGGALIVNSGLWALTFGNGGNGSNPTSLYVTAGLAGETEGLLARIDVPEPTLGLLLVSVAMLGLTQRKSHWH
jgi:uncharacterized protein (TIGR03118 family)